MLRNISNQYGIFVICVVFIIIRLLYLPQSLMFGSDQARDFFAVHDLVIQKHIPLIGPPSQFTVSGHQFFFGPLPYYLLVPALLLSQWSPVGVSVFFIVLNALVLALFLRVSLQYMKDTILIGAFAFLYTFSPIMITTTRSYWNPYVMLPIALLLLTTLILVMSHQKARAYHYFLIGLWYGLGLQAHYSFLLIIAIAKIVLIVKRKISVAQAVIVVGGFLIGFSPLFLFELRNHFYNTRVFWQYFTSSHSPFVFQSYYLVSLLPLVMVIGAWFGAKLYRSSRLVAIGFLGFFLLYAAIQIVIPPSMGDGMVAGWNYPGIQKVAQIIAMDRPKNFNVADQLTLDNRATPIRYELMRKGITPKGVTEYSGLQNLYILSREPLANLLTHPVYELAASKQFSLSQTWQLQNGIKLYKLTSPK